ncbi:MAG TPA: MFS transporter [Spirochaetia bacterium]
MPQDRRVAVSGFANYFILSLTTAILAPYLQLYLKARGMSPSRIGVLLGLLELAGVVGPILIGRLADRRTAYRALLALCFLVPAAVFIPMQLTAAFPVYLVCIVVMGFTYRATIPLLDSLVSRILPDPTQQYGPLRVAGSLGFIAVSLFLQFSGLVSGDSSLSILITFGVGAIVAAAMTVLLPPAPRAHATHRSGPVRGEFDARFWVVIVVILLGRFGIGAYYSFFSLYLKQTFPDSGVSLLWAIGPLAEAGPILFSGSIIRRFGVRAMLVVSLAAVTVRLFLFSVAPSIAVVALAQLLHAFTFGTFHTASVAYINGKISPARRGMGMAIYNSVGLGLSAFLASVIGGFVLENHGFVFLFVSYAAVPLLGILILAVAGKKLFENREPVPAVAPR